MFPFPFFAYYDAAYEVGFMGDAKTAGQKGQPDWLDRHQILLYTMPFYYGGDDRVPIIDKIVMHKEWSVEESFQSFAIEHEQSHYEALTRDVYWAADRISAGDFPPNPGWMCSYAHGFSDARVMR